MDLFDLFVKITADSSEYDKALDDAKGKASSFGDGIGKILGGAGKLAMTGIAAAAGGVSALAMQSLDAYGNYEQLVGGVQKLYGNMGQSLEDYVAAAKEQGVTAEEAELKWHYLEQAQTDVLNNAKEAYRTAGMSANQYMETATSFSAALINSLEGDTVAAAQQTDIAMRAISDNVNTFGSSMDSVTNAFMGFSKQNYTMLDNLKLGYGGTKAEMERLIEDANAYAEANGKAADLSIDSFSDIVTAIQYVQEQQNIAGTTAREAAGTIQGSIGMLKGAWENLIAGFSNPDADLGKLINDVVDSATTAFNNILPAVERGLEGIGNFIGQIAPILAQQLPGIFDTVLPVAIKAFTQFVNSLSTSLPSIVQVLVDQLPTLITGLLPALIQAAGTLAIALIQALPDIVMSIYEALKTTIKTGLPVLIDVGQSIFDTLFGNINIEEVLAKAKATVENVLDRVFTVIPELLEQGTVFVTDFINSFFADLPGLLETGLDLILDLITSSFDMLLNIMNVESSMLTMAENIISAFINGISTSLPKIITKIVDFITQLAATVLQSLPQFITMIGNLVNQLLTMVAELFIQLVNAVISNGPTIISGVIQIVTNIVQAVVANLPAIITAFINVFVQLLSTLLNYGSQLVSSIGTVMSNLISMAVTWLSKLPERMGYFAGLAAKNFVNAVKNLPSDAARLFTEVFNKLVKFGQDFIAKAPEIATKFKDDLIKFLSELPDKMVELGTNIVEGLKRGIQNVWDSFIGWIIDKAKQFLTGWMKAWDEHSPSKKMMMIGAYAIEGLQIGMQNELPAIEDTVAEMANIVSTPISTNYTGVKGSGYDSQSTFGTEENTTLEALADAIVAAFIRADISVECDRREFGRLVGKLGAI